MVAQAFFGFARRASASMVQRVWCVRAGPVCRQVRKAGRRISSPRRSCSVLRMMNSRTGNNLKPHCDFHFHFHWPWLLHGGS